MPTLAAAAVLCFILGAQAYAGGELPDGWDQIDTESYHGPEGWYHDSVSGALVRYWAGRIPNEAGIGPASGGRCLVSSTPPPPCVLSVNGREIQIFIGPYATKSGEEPGPLVMSGALAAQRQEGPYSSYWATIDTPEQMQRVQALALTNPLARRLYSGHRLLDRDPREGDLRSVAVGMPLGKVLELLGDPSMLEGTSDGGFTAEFIIWGRWPARNWRLTWASRNVRLRFSRARILTEVNGRPTRG